MNYNILAPPGPNNWSDNKSLNKIDTRLSGYHVCLVITSVWLSRLMEPLIGAKIDAYHI